MFNTTPTTQKSSKPKQPQNIFLSTGYTAAQSAADTRKFDTSLLQEALAVCSEGDTTFGQYRIAQKKFPDGGTTLLITNEASALPQFLTSQETQKLAASLYPRDGPTRLTLANNILQYTKKGFKFSRAQLILMETFQHNLAAECTTKQQLASAVLHLARHVQYRYSELNNADSKPVKSEAVTKEDLLATFVIGLYGTGCFPEANDYATIVMNCAAVARGVLNYFVKHSSIDMPGSERELIGSTTLSTPRDTKTAAAFMDEVQVPHGIAPKRPGAPSLPRLSELSGGAAEFKPKVPVLPAPVPAEGLRVHGLKESEVVEHGPTVSYFLSKTPFTFRSDWTSKLKVGETENICEAPVHKAVWDSLKAYTESYRDASSSKPIFSTRTDSVAAHTQGITPISPRDRTVLTWHEQLAIAFHELVERPPGYSLKRSTLYFIHLLSLVVPLSDIERLLFWWCSRFSNNVSLQRDQNGDMVAPEIQECFKIAGIPWRNAPPLFFFGNLDLAWSLKDIPTTLPPLDELPSAIPPELLIMADPAYQEEDAEDDMIADEYSNYSDMVLDLQAEEQRTSRELTPGDFHHISEDLGIDPAEYLLYICKVKGPFKYALSLLGLVAWMYPETKENNVALVAKTYPVESEEGRKLTVPAVVLAGGNPVGSGVSYRNRGRGGSGTRGGRGKKHEIEQRSVVGYVPFPEAHGQRGGRGMQNTSQPERGKGKAGKGRAQGQTAENVGRGQGNYYNQRQPERGRGGKGGGRSGHSLQHNAASYPLPGQAFRNDRPPTPMGGPPKDLIIPDWMYGVADGPLPWQQFSYGPSQPPAPPYYPGPSGYPGYIWGGNQPSGGAPVPLMLGNYGAGPGLLQETPGRLPFPVVSGDAHLHPTEGQEGTLKGKKDSSQDALVQNKTLRNREVSKTSTPLITLQSTWENIAHRSPLAFDTSCDPVTRVSYVLLGPLLDACYRLWGLSDQGFPLAQVYSVVAGLITNTDYKANILMQNAQLKDSQGVRMAIEAAMKSFSAHPGFVPRMEGAIMRHYRDNAGNGLLDAVLSHYAKIAPLVKEHQAQNGSFSTLGGVLHSTIK